MTLIRNEFGIGSTTEGVRISLNPAGHPTVDPAVTARSNCALDHEGAQHMRERSEQLLAEEAK